MPQPPAKPASRAAPALASIAILIAAIVGLLLEGRIWWCDCGTWWPWWTDVWSSHCSQHLLDPYSITHLSHGLIFYAALAWLAPRLALGWRLAIALAIAGAWEVLENSAFIINRYREATMSLDYIGDSITNAIGDMLSCAFGFWLAHRIGIRYAALLFVATEILLLFMIRDNLTLNVIMLIRPIDAIKDWQSQGHTPAA
jgi:hypothetical protein